MINYYKLDENNNPVACKDIFEMSEWMHNNLQRTIVEKTYLPNDVEVSTVFLGLDHGLGESDYFPILFETMIFGGEHDQYQERYTTWDEAVKGHQVAVKLVKGEQ